MMPKIKHIKTKSEFDEEKNHIKFTVPDDSPNGSSPKFEVEAEVF